MYANKIMDCKIMHLQKKYKPTIFINGMSLNTCKAFVFDLDGTVYCGNSLMDEARELIEFLKSKTIRVFYCTNNSTKTRQEICIKLNNMGLSVSLDEIYSAAYATAHYVAGENISEVFCIGSPGLQDELKSFDISIVTEPEKASVVIIGLDRTIDYERMMSLLTLRGKPCHLIACNREKFFPSDGGKLQLGCGFIVTLVEELLDRKIDYVVGKPNGYMLNMLAEEEKLAMNDIIMVGDSIESDIAMAQATGCHSIYVSQLYKTGAPGFSRVKSLKDIQSLFRR